MSRLGMRTTILLALVAVALLAACTQSTAPTATPGPVLTPTPIPSPTPTATPTWEAPTAHSTQEGVSLVDARVLRVVDGDTIEVDINGASYTVRYIGVDTPETVHPSKPVECFGKEASEKNRALVEDRVVVLEKDVSEVDRYGRLLRYVWAGDVMVNAELVRLGYAQVSTYPPDVRYQDLFVQLQREAREKEMGLWGQCVSAETASPPPSKASGCDPCYPDVCIPPYPPDLDCGDIPYKDFRAICDPHGFDGDHDGIGCER